MNPETGECDTEAAIDEMYRANGKPCQLDGCTHTSAGIYNTYGKDRREGRAFMFLCACCLLLKRLERAKQHASQIERLEAEYEKEKTSCM